MSSNFGHMGPQTTELAAKNTPLTYNGGNGAVSMTSERSRSRSRSGSGHRSSSSERLGRYINEELIRRVQNANNATESSSKGPTKQIPDNGEKQTVHGTPSDNTYLSTHDIEMKKLEHHNDGNK